MFFQTLDLTTALRPELLPDESLLFVQDGVGLYEGKFKLPNYQFGHVYLTSHRICYVDNADARRNSTAIALKAVDRYDYYVRAGFLKSSPKITLYPKAAKRTSLQHRTQITHSPASQSPSRSGNGSPFPGRSSPANRFSPAPPPPKPASVSWVCPICSFSNTLPPGFDATTANEHTVLPPCQACGIKPPLAHLLKAAIASAASRPVGPPAEAPSQPLLETHGQYTDRDNDRDYTSSHTSQPAQPSSTVRCPRCTFENHPSLLSCEICGGSLVSADAIVSAPIPNGDTFRTSSPGPSSAPSQAPEDIQAEYIKISFRVGGDKIFHERLKNAMVQRKWLLEHAPAIPSTSQPTPDHLSARGSGTSTPDPKGVGIAGLERLGLERQKNNQNVISSAFEDLEALMASAKEIIALAESFAEKTPDGNAAKLLNDSAAGLGMSMTKDMLDSAAGSDGLYLSELSRALAEYLTDDRQNVLKREGGVMSLVDLWAAFNRARNGVELVSPLDFEKAARMWEKLGLPVRLREFKNGLLVVQRHDWTDDKVIALLLGWLQTMHEEEPKEGVEWDQSAFGRGFTAQEAAAKFGWSVGVAVEELHMAEEKGVLCREEGIEGLKFWENYIGSELLSGN